MSNEPDWRALFLAERGEAAPDGWVWFDDDGWAKGMRDRYGEQSFRFPPHEEASRNRTVLRAMPPSERGSEPWLWIVFMWMNAEEVTDPHYYGSAWEPVTEGFCPNALEAIAAAEAAVQGDRPGELRRVYLAGCI